MPPKKNPEHLSTGEVVIVSKELVPQSKPVIELSHHAAEKLRPKRPLSEKQKENLTKLIERNKAKAAAWKAGMGAPSDLSAIPEDQVAVQVKPKRAYTKKDPKGHYLSQPLPSAVSKPVELPEPEEESEEPTPAPSPKKAKRAPKPQAPRARARPAPSVSWSDDEEEEKPLRRRRVVSDTSDFDSDDEDHYVKKYVTKTNQRLQAVKQIEQQIAQHVNPYASRGMSIF